MWVLLAFIGLIIVAMVGKWLILLGFVLLHLFFLLAWPVIGIGCVLFLIWYMFVKPGEPKES